MAKPRIPYGRQCLDEDDIQAVTDVLRSDWLTQGPTVERFEKAVAEYCGARYAVAVSSGTAALHLAALAAGFGPEDDVITSPITFAATANAIVYTGARPVFADIDSATCCIDPQQISGHLTDATRGVIPVHFAGHPCDMAQIGELAAQRGLVVVEDAAHAIGASYEVEGQTFNVGCCVHSDMTAFSFHPVKQMTTGEGGVVTTNSEEYYERLRLLRTHGITRDPRHFTRNDGPWYYEMISLGFNYRITDIQCALGLSQLGKLDRFVARRRQIAAAYGQAFRDADELTLPVEAAGVRSSCHLYVLQLKSMDRRAVFDALSARGLGVNVHYIPLHLQPYYRQHFGFCEGDFPEAEKYYSRAITLPLFPAMSDDEVAYVIESVKDVLKGYRR